MSTSLPYVVLGAGGRLGGQFLVALRDRAVGLRHSEADLVDAARLEAVLLRLKPGVVINAAAYNFVDRAEEERAEALAVNFAGPHNLARLCQREGWRLVHFSTDYVFADRPERQPYSERDRPAPATFYGLSKLMGEQAVMAACQSALVLRVAHLYGGHTDNPLRLDLVQRFLEQARTQGVLQASQGQFLNPTAVQDVVAVTLALLETQATGLFHVTGGGQCSVKAFAAEVLRLGGKSATILETDDPRRTARPRYSVLDNQRLREVGLADLPDWRVSLQVLLHRATAL
ncbi:MAG: SDR family oxidoreductase [Terriglobales bacterium]